MNADCLLNLFTIFKSMVSIKNSNNLMMSVSENFLLESEQFFFIVVFPPNKICPLLKIR